MTVVPAYKRIRKHHAKVDKWSILRRYKFARLRMVREYEPHAKAEYLIDTFAHDKMILWELTAYIGRLYFDWMRGIYKLTLIHRGNVLEMKFYEARHYFVRAIAYNLWLDQAPVLRDLTPEQIIATPNNELYKLIDESEMFAKPIKTLINISEDYIRFLSVAYAFNIPTPKIDLELEKLARYEPAKYEVKFEGTETV